MSLPIYKHEFEAGLAEQIKTSASIAFHTKAKPFKFDSPSLDEIHKALTKITHPNLAVAGIGEQWDLYPMNSILVSVGWNSNDDVFDSGETWAARHSPVFKKVNFMHDEKDMIGVMVASIVMDHDGNIIPDDIDSIPSVYDIVVASVLYKKWSDPELQTRMDNIIEAIAKDEYFVSMECLFRNFDYAVVTPNGEHRIVARNNDSSFLTKHLRIYGGSGEYEGHQVGRLLRSFAFSGKGLVDNPANPRSIILSKDVDPFQETEATNILANVNNIPMEKVAMTTANDNSHVVDQLRSDLNKSEARNDKLETKMNGLVEAAQKAERDRVEKEIAGLRVDVEDLEKQVSIQKSDLDTKATEISQLEKSVKEGETKLSEAEIKIAEVEVEKVKASRISKLVEAGISSEEATGILETWTDASDEQFAKVVALHATSKKHMEEDKDKDKEKGKFGKGKASDEDSNDGDAENADLENAEANTDANLGVPNSNEQEELSAVASKWFSSVLKSGKTEEKE